MGKTAFIFPGQGSQYVGMGKDFYERFPLAAEVFALAQEASGLPVAKICFEPNEEIHITKYTQIAMLAAEIAMLRVLEQEGIKAGAAAGLSLGEYSAIAAAGGMSELDAIRLVRKRGILMQNTVPAGEGAMCAVMAMDAGKIEEVIAPIDGVSIANYNCPGQIVITGEKHGVEQAAEVLKEAGAKRTVMLNVSGPFHSPMLIPAGEKLAGELADVQMSPLKIPYVTNVTTEIISDISRTKELLKEQVSSPVRWMQSMEVMIENGVDTFIEIGPGRTLAGFMKKINRDVKVYNIAALEDIEKVAAEMEASC